MAERMLIIDDGEAVLKSCSKIFTAEGFDVVITRSPQEGLRRASDSYFDVILCDWRMLGLDEMDLVEELDRCSPDSTLVMINGYPTVDHATEVMKRGAMDYIAKPFTPEEIINAVNRAAKRKAAEERKVMRRFVSFLEVLLNARNDKEQK
jgi:DNA-binding NtrC family response regulator